MQPLAFARLVFAATCLAFSPAFSATTVNIWGELVLDGGGDETKSFRIEIVYDESFSPVVVPYGSPIGYLYGPLHTYPAELDYYLFPVAGVIRVSGRAEGYGSFTEGTAKGQPIYPAAGEVLLFDGDIRVPGTHLNAFNGTFTGPNLGFDVGVLMGGFALYDVFLMNDYDWSSFSYQMSVTKTPDTGATLPLLLPLFLLFGLHRRRFRTRSTNSSAHRLRT